MSFLLDALRKSENQKRLGNVPTIHSTADLGARPGKQFKLSLIALVLLPALVVVAWYGWQMFSQPDESPVQVSQPANQAETSVTRTAQEPAPNMQDEVLPAIPQHLPPGSRTKDSRTPVEAFEPPPAAKPAPEPENTTLQSGVLEIEAIPETISPGTEAENRAAALDVISYWQLPESIRQELPEFRISVLVYAEVAEDRFVLMNGKRLVEGSEPQSGLVLEEIRRKGVVFSYRLYRFIVSR
jgi:general secretion pathway protein B